MKVVKITELQKQMSMIAIAAAFCLSLGVFLEILPSFKRIRQSQNEVGEFRHKQELLGTIQAAKTKIQESESWLNEKKDRNLTLSYFSTLAKKHEIEIETVTPEPSVEDNNSGYASLIVRVEMRAHFQNLISMVTELGTTKPRFEVVEMMLAQIPSLEIQKKASQKALRITLVLKTLLMSSKNTTKTLGAN